MHTSKVIWELAQKKETLKYSGKLWQNEERAPSCGLTRDIPVNADIHYDVTDQAKESTMETFSKNSWGISFTLYTKQGLFPGGRTKITDISKHMALLTVIFTSVNKNKILTCTGMQKWNKTSPFPLILCISNFTRLILKWQYHRTNWYTVPNIVHTTLHTSITHDQEIVVQ